MSAGRSPRRFWIVVAATAVTMGVTASLGFWQLSRAAEKRALESAIEARGVLPALNQVDLLSSADPTTDIHRPVNLSGHWVQGVNLYLDNRPMNGRSGFVLLTPLRLQGSERVVLVQRGWVPRNFIDRTQVPEIDTPVVEVQVQGRLAPPPSQLFELGEGEPGPIRQNINIPALAAETGLPLLGGVSVLQTGQDTTTLQRDWPRFAADVHKHLGYAAQWFAMCAIAGGLFVWYQIIIPRRKKRTPHGTDSR
jgi:surfeit locus 1 family protein